MKKSDTSGLRKVELVIVDDGSKDTTLELIKDYTKQFTTDKNLIVRGFQQKQNQGKGAAVKYVTLHFVIIGNRGVSIQGASTFCLLTQMEPLISTI